MSPLSKQDEWYVKAYGVTKREYEEYKMRCDLEDYHDEIRMASAS